MSKNIDIKEAIFDKTSDFSVKRFKIGDIDIERPTKVIDGKKINKPLFEEERKHFKNILFETSKIVKPDSIAKLLHETDSSQIRDWFGLKDWISKYPHATAMTFDFNPYQQYHRIDEISGYFNYYYEYSDTALFVPNIKVEKYEYTVDSETQKKRGKPVPIMHVEKYLQFVDESYQILDKKNTKPIFVPVSLRLNIDDIKKLAAEYIKKEYFNIWIDFEGAPTTLKAKRARIRQFLTEIEKLERLNEIVVYCTNIKREITSNPLASESPSSDILASIIGANIIGVNREPPRFVEKIDVTLPLEEQQKLKDKQKEKTKEMKVHKARVFNPKSYYYQKVKELDLSVTESQNLMNEKFNTLHNAQLLDSEFESQTNYFLEKGARSIEKYVTDKSMVKQYHEGELVKTLFGAEKKIIEWF
jgi:hypothetical protein